MVTQQQATASIASIGVILGYVLWSLIGTGVYLPYIQIGTPHVGNIMLFLVLFSLVVSAILTVFVSFGITLVSWLRKREQGIIGTTVWTIFITFFLAIFPALILHIFSLVPLWVTLLSYALFCGIVGYGKFKERNKYKKYLTASSGTGDGKNSVKV